MLKSNILIRFVPGLNLFLKSNLQISGYNNVVILGPATLYNFGIYFTNCTNVIVKDVRIFNATIYGVLVYHSNNVIIDHCTIIDAGRTSVDKGKCIDITEESKNVTASNNILAYSYPIQELIKYKGLLAANFLEGPV